MEDPQLEYHVSGFILDTIRECWSTLPEEILNPFGCFVSEAVIFQRPEIAFGFDKDEIRRLICPFTAPSRNGESDEGCIVAHWAPLTKSEAERFQTREAAKE